MVYTTVTNIQQNKQNNVNKHREKCPSEFIGPITLELMIDPVFIEDGHTYERAAIKQWFDSSLVSRSPLTNIPISSTLVQNHTLKSMIDRYRNDLGTELLDICKFHPPHGLLKSIDDLLQLGVNPNTRNSTGDTPLMLLFHNTQHTLNHHSEEMVTCIQALVTGGALMSCVNDHNLTLRDMVKNAKDDVPRNIMVTVSLLEKRETSGHALQQLLPPSHKTEEHMTLVLPVLNTFISTTSELPVILKVMGRYVTATIWGESAYMDDDEDEDDENYRRFIRKKTTVFITCIIILLVVSWL